MLIKGNKCTIFQNTWRKKKKSAVWYFAVQMCGNELRGGGLFMAYQMEYILDQVIVQSKVNDVFDQAVIIAVKYSVCAVLVINL